jgi:hypothetical protein
MVGGRTLLVWWTAVKRFSEFPCLGGPPAGTSVTAQRLSLGGRGDTETGRHGISPSTGVFDVSAMGHYLGNQTLWRKRRRKGKQKQCCERTGICHLEIKKNALPRPVSGTQVADLYRLQNDLDNNPTVCHSRVIHLTVKVYNEWFSKHFMPRKPCVYLLSDDM